MARTAKGVTVVDHPLVQHKLTLMRKKDTSTKSFRQLLKEIGALLCYEVTRDLPLELIEIETPMQTMQAPQLVPPSTRRVVSLPGRPPRRRDPAVRR